MNIVVFGLSITSSWGNGHATTYRSLIKALAARGHAITFVERDVPWYSENRDLRRTSYCDISLYCDLSEIPRRYGRLVRNADLVIMGSYVPDGIALGNWITVNARGITAFYDIDTPVTLARMKRGHADYISPALIPRFDLYLSFTGGPALDVIEETYGSPRARALYCAVDPDLHTPLPVPQRYALGYLGTYSVDRQPALERLLMEPAHRNPNAGFIVAGAQYPDDIPWPANVEHVEHLPPQNHPMFFGSQRYTLNITRTDMVTAGYSPSVRLFEAAACGVPVISDRWPGLETFFTPGSEILVADSSDDVLRILRETSEAHRLDIGAAARRRVLHEHTAARRAQQLEQYCRQVSADGVGALCLTESRRALSTS